jgi:hypothetical protein
MPEDPSRDDVPDGRRNGLIALGIVVLLVVAGWILVYVLRNSSRLQDCVMSGRTNCAPIEAADQGR